MDNFEQACVEIAEEIKKNNPKTKRELNQLKLRILNKYQTNGKLETIPKNADIYFSADDETRKKFKELLSLKPVRTLSGVAPIALMCEPYPCPHTVKGIGPCSYCPGGIGSVFGDVPQSYTGKEPSTRRAIRNNYDPYLMVFNRLEHYVAMGKVPDKAEIIIQGGTFTFFPKEYQEYFVKYTLKAMNDFSKLFFDKEGNIDILKFKKFFELPRTMSENDKRTKSVQQKLLQIKNLDLKDFTKIQKENETSFIRCVGLTIETRSDFAKQEHGNLMLELGCTRVELGIQSIYDDVLEAVNRGSTTADNIDSIRTLKDLGFKINCHYMIGLPNTTKEMDLNGLKQLFENPDYRPDMLKIYPCMVMNGTRTYDDWKAGKFTPLTTQEAAEMIAEAKQYVPKWCRIMRVQRDIPTSITAGGVDRTNLRQYVEKICKENEIKCNCIRCREIGFRLRDSKKIEFSNMQTTITEYPASNGKEFFIAAEDLQNDVLFGFCRLRFPSQFLRQEVTKDSALIRELHVFSSAVQIGKRDKESFQHKGIGKSLLMKAEEVSKQNGKNKIVIISGIGAREYFRKFGYELEGAYMVKVLE